MFIDAGEKFEELVFHAKKLEKEPEPDESGVPVHAHTHQQTSVGKSAADEVHDTGDSKWQQRVDQLSKDMAEMKTW